MSNQTFTLRSAMPVSATELYDWHSRPAAFSRLAPPWEAVKIIEKKGAFGDGHTVTLWASLLGPIGKRWVAELYDVIPGKQFRDRQLTGPFASWNHTHTMIPDGPTRSYLDDSVEYRVPFGAIGTLFGGGLVQSKLAAMFAYRHALTSSDLRRHNQFADRPRLKIVITGSRGLIGNELADFLSSGGHEVIRFVRGVVKPSAFDDGTKSVTWNPEELVDPALLEGVDAIIHLAGDGIADGRWSAAKKKRILRSRTVPTRKLAESIATMTRKPKVFLSASAIGIYGDRGDQELDETSPDGTGFLADVCQQWEVATEPAKDAGVRVVNLRTGVVQTPRGGALGKQLPAFKTGAGAVLGSGKQWVSWITINDLIGAFHHCMMTDTLHGPVNIVAPNPVTNRDYGRSLATVLGRPYLFTIPAPVLRTLFGEMADAALLGSAKIQPRKLLESGFHFDHATLESGLRFVLGR